MRQVLIFAGLGAAEESGHPRICELEFVPKDIYTFDAWRLAHERHDVEQIMYIHNFHKRMQKFIQSSTPTVFHDFVADLSKNAGYDLTVVTTNVDDLFQRACQRAHVKEPKIIHLYGSCLKRRCPVCQQCFKDDTSIWSSADQIQCCPQPKCASPLVKTDVTFHGEHCSEYIVSIQAFNKLQADDILIMVGSVVESTTDVTKRLWESCRKRHVHTIHVNSTPEAHMTFPSDFALYDSICTVISDLELHMRIRRQIESIVE